MKQYDQPAEAPLITAYKLAHTLNTDEGRRIAALISDHNHSDTEPGSKPVNLARLGVTLAYVVVLVALAAYTVTVSVTPKPPRVVCYAEREYYRGVYDSTRVFFRFLIERFPAIADNMFGVSDPQDASIVANEIVKSTRAARWYDDPSDGFEDK